MRRALRPGGAEMEQSTASALVAIAQAPWAILPATLSALLESARAGVTSDGPTAGPQVRYPAAAAPMRPGARGAGGIAVLPMIGVLSQRPQFWGGMGTDIFTQIFRQAVADPNVGAIVLEVDSPGGSVSGMTELAAVIFEARKEKKIVAVASSLMASAAYWVASAAAELVVTPSGEVGSIGVYGIHVDQSKALELAGLKITEIAAGRFKTEGSPFKPLSGEAHKAMEKLVHGHYNRFIDDVARGRGVPPSRVRDGFGEGRVVGAQEAVKLGMADRVATLDATIARLRGA